MSVAFKRGTTSGPSDLTITIRDIGGALIDPYRLEYAVFDKTTGIEVLMGSPVNSPERISTGQYFARVPFPADCNVGDWLIRWTIQETTVDPVYQSVQEFNVVGDGAIVAFTGDVNLDRLVYSLRVMLRDQAPDRNYRFRPPAHQKFIQGQTQVFGFIWEDEELLEYIYWAIDDFNSRPPVTGIDVTDLWGSLRRWRTSILLRAAAFACFAIAMNWVADEFSVHRDELVTVKDKEGNEHTLKICELFDLIYGDSLKEMAAEVKKEVQIGIKEAERVLETI